MADLNQTYYPFFVKIDFRAIKDELWYEFFTDENPVKKEIDKFLNELALIDSQQAITATAVSVPFLGSGNAQRVVWLRERIDSVYRRLDLIRGLVEGYKANIVSLGGTPPTSILSSIGTVLAVIPATFPVGVAATVIGKLVNNSNSNQIYVNRKLQEAQTAISGFVQDTAQLKEIHNQLISELAIIPNVPTGTNGEPTNNAPNIRIDYVLYIAGALIVIVYVLYRRRKRFKRRKR